MRHWQGQWVCILLRVVAPMTTWFIGRVGVTLIGLSLLHVSRTSILTLLFDLPYERALRWHRLAALLGVLAVFTHFISMILSISISILFDPNAVYYPRPLFGIIALTLFITTAILGVLLRSRNWELFYFPHQVLGPLGAFIILFHNQATLPFILPGLVLWAVDRAIRRYKSCLPIIVLSRQVYGEDVTYLELGVAKQSFQPLWLLGYQSSPDSIDSNRNSNEIVPFDFTPGQYEFIRVKEISNFEWHPFSLCRALSQEGTFKLMIKVCVSICQSHALTSWIIEHGTKHFYWAIAFLHCQ